MPDLLVDTLAPIKGQADFEIIIFCGIPASGKTTYYELNYKETHVHISLDRLNTRRKERLLLEECLGKRVSCVIDNTNVLLEERKVYIDPAKKAGARVVGYFFQSKVTECLERNELRAGKSKVSPVAMYAKSKQMVFPSIKEGFDELYYVSIGTSGYQIQQWKED